jgi:hypothetical protein
LCLGRLPTPPGWELAARPPTPIDIGGSGYTVEVAMVGTRASLVVALILTACGGPPPPGPPIALPEAGAPAPPVVRRPVEAQAAPGSPASTLPAPAPETPAPAPRTAAPAAAEPPVAIPAGAVYACVVDAAGERQVTAIEFAPRVAALCAQNPEMSPCQYEREVCRTSGGRVYAADGTEITKATETEYDRRVLRVRINSN